MAQRAEDVQPAPRGGEGPPPLPALAALPSSLQLLQQCSGAALLPRPRPTACPCRRASGLAAERCWGGSGTCPAQSLAQGSSGAWQSLHITPPAEVPLFPEDTRSLVKKQTLRISLWL